MPSVLENKIKNFTNAVEKSIEDENWYSALALALALPDICGNLQDPKRSSSDKYIGFFNDFIKQKYTRLIGDPKEPQEFLNGRDMYALRCSFLHAGEVEISKQRIKNVLDGYIFLKPNNIIYAHMNKVNDTLQLQIDVFCKHIIQAVNEWLISYKNIKEIEERAELMIDIVGSTDNISF
ncbi:hypothetical protein CHR37_04625 [Bacillus velezensis]|uniref:Apea-like HEPN domain-containing protein n=1 Tax=Bacillus velezensis TaxID=492670 RepID=A0ABC8DA29_BACVE|nr:MULTISPECIES: hypothetical protein [Bacillus]ANB49230.1 hypothetical protein A1D33_018245 [Bacillus velezensis]AVI29039.1 hypothetical protein C3Z10_11900 [Bacillus velezensis]AWX72694.1 hypothetical protein BVDSYZ_11925 [Bacillus velezensis]MBR7816723.1 hypothetical protein [Bacillus sp. CCNWLCWHY013]MBT9285959.1 hypothetical protein [Bacillus velezensis]